MSWGSDDLTRITYSAVDFWFAPTQLVYRGVPDAIANQLVQKAESGIVLFQQLSDTDEVFFEFSVKGMQELDWTSAVGTTIRGFAVFQTLIKDSLNFRQNSCTLKPAGGSSTFTVQYWDGSFVGFPWVSQNGVKRFGDGSQVIRFRQVIT